MWVDYIDPDHRDFEQCRYTVITAVNEGDDDDPDISGFDDSLTVFESESPAALVGFLDGITP